MSVGCFGSLISHDFIETFAVILSHRRVQGGWRYRSGAKGGQPARCHVQLEGQLVVGRFASKFVFQFGRGTADVQQLVSNVDWQANCLGLI